MYDVALLLPMVCFKSVRIAVIFWFNEARALSSRYLAPLKKVM